MPNNSSVLCKMLLKVCGLVAFMMKSCYSINYIDLLTAPMSFNKPYFLNVILPLSVYGPCRSASNVNMIFEVKY